MDSTTSEHMNGSIRKKKTQFIVPSLLVVNIAGLAALAWMVDVRFTEINRDVGVIHAVQDERFIVEQNAFSMGRSDYYCKIDRYSSLAEFVIDYEVSFLGSQVTSGSYGTDWYLVNESNNVIPFSSHYQELSLHDAGIKPGDVLRVVKKRQA